KPWFAWRNPADIIQGTRLGATQLNAMLAEMVNGMVVSVRNPVLTYTPGAGTVLPVGTNEPLTVAVGERDNYLAGTFTVHINVIAAPSATTSGVTGVMAHSATVLGTVNAHAAATTVTVQYGTQPGIYTNSVTLPTRVGGAANTPVSVTLINL